MAMISFEIEEDVAQDFLRYCDYFKCTPSEALETFLVPVMVSWEKTKELEENSISV